MERLNVFFGRALVGVMGLDGRFRFNFRYDEAWRSDPDSFPLSISLPLQEAVFPHETAGSFFANLLPESTVRDVVARRLGISERNDFLMLKHIGGECAGAISILPKGGLPERPDQYEYRPLSSNRMSDLIQRIPTRPLLAGEDGIRISLAGAQEKLALMMRDDTFYIPMNGAPSNVILKPAMVHFPSSLENECFCMMLARDMGLPVPEVEMIDPGSQKALVIHRYDRITGDDGVRRLHQEDFCQAMGLSHALKYQADGGPGLKECFGLVRDHSANPVRDLQHLLHWVFFNFLTGNMDGHGKNLSFLYRSRQVRLAPFYDMLCTRIYEDLTTKLAMKIGGENRLEWVMPRHWDRMADEVGISPGVVRKRLNDFCQKMRAQIDATHGDYLDKYGANDLVEKIMITIRKRAG